MWKISTLIIIQDNWVKQNSHLKNNLESLGDVCSATRRDVITESIMLLLRGLRFRCRLCGTCGIWARIKNWYFSAPNSWNWFDLKDLKFYLPDCWARKRSISRWQLIQGAQDCSILLSKASNSRSKSDSLWGTKFFRARTLYSWLFSQWGLKKKNQEMFEKKARIWIFEYLYLKSFSFFS